MMTTRNSEQEKGFVMVMVALTLVILIGFVALGVDSGVLYSARTAAQEAADAAALAGAFTFINNPTGSQPSTATNFATQIALNNKILGKAITAGDVNVSVDTVNKRVTVIINSTQTTYFAKALGAGSAAIGVTSIAEAADESSGTCCTRPWFIPNTVYATTDICTAKCDASQPLIDPVTKEVTAYATAKIGQEFLLKPQSPDAALSPSEFYLIDLPDADGKTSGGASYKDNIVHGAPAASACLNSYSVLTGNMVGPTKSGVTDLVGNPPNYTWTSPGHYTRVSDGKVFDMAPNVVVSPIWDVCSLTSFCPDGKMSGTTPTLQIIGFAVLFVDGVQGPGVNARLINVSSCGPGAGTDEEGSSTLTLPLRLIRI
jgi:Flp pilus assembly protein TadG